MTIRDLADIMKALEKLGDMSKFLEQDSEPEIFAANRTFKVGVKKDFKCGLTSKEIKSKVNKICLTPDLKNFYTLTPEYYLDIPNIKDYEFFGELESIKKQTHEIVPEGFGTLTANLTKINLI